MSVEVFYSYAASGMDKSSFLQARLIPALRALGHPVALNRRPDEPGIARRLIAELIDLPEDLEVPDGDPQGFARLLKKVGELGPRRPVLPGAGAGAAGGSGRRERSEGARDRDLPAGHRGASLHRGG